MRGDERICQKCKRQGTNGFQFVPLSGHEGVYLCICANASACRGRRVRVRADYQRAVKNNK